MDTFYWVIELSKPNLTCFGVSLVYVECKTKRIWAIAYLGIEVRFS